MTFASLVRQKELGSIKIGDSKNHAITILGNPAEISIRKKTEDIWRYGALELYFLSKNHHSIIEMIIIHFPHSTECHNDFIYRLDINGWFPDNETSIDQLEEQVAKERFHCEIDPALTFNDTQRTYIIDYNLLVIFRNDNNTWKIDKIILK